MSYNVSEQSLLDDTHGLTYDLVTLYMIVQSNIHVHLLNGSDGTSYVN